MSLIEEAKELERRIEKIYNGEKDVTNDLISDIRNFVLDENGEINKTVASVLREYTELKLVPRKVNTIDGPSIVFGIQYKNIGIEIGKLK